MSPATLGQRRSCVRAAWVLFHVCQETEIPHLMVSFMGKLGFETVWIWGCPTFGEIHPKIFPKPWILMRSWGFESSRMPQTDQVWEELGRAK